MTQGQIIENLRDRVAELEEEVRQLRAQTVLTEAYRVPVEWRLTAKEEALALAFAKRGTLSKDAVMAALWSPKWDLDGEPSPKLVDVFVHNLRKKLAPHGLKIITQWGRGYVMPDDSRDKMKVT